MSPPRILRVMHTIAGLKSSAGGTSNSVTVACSELAGAGAEVCLVSQDFGSASDRNVLPEEEVRVSLAKASHLPFIRSVYSPGYRALVERTCLESNTDLVHDHGLWLPANHAVVSVCRKLRVPLIVSPHGMLSPSALDHDRTKKALAWRVFQRRDLAYSHAICVTSAQEADDVRAKGYDKPIAVIPHGVKLPNLRTGFAPSTAPRIALFLGRIHPMKGLLHLIDAWAMVRPEGWRVVVAGPDEDGYQKVVSDAVGRAGLESVFEFVGPAYGESKSGLHESASLFISPSLSENFGMAIAEALAQALPVITTQGTPWSSIARAGCGWWVGSSVPDLANAIREATDLPTSELKAMGVRGRILIQESFEWSRIASMLIEFYGWVLGEEPRPDFVVGA